MKFAQVQLVIIIIQLFEQVLLSARACLTCSKIRQHNLKAFQGLQFKEPTRQIACLLHALVLIVL